jgi:rhodanese-related sulfurtransferase
MTRTTATAPTIRQLTPTELRQRLDGRTARPLIDVRPPGEFAAVHLDGSHNVPLDLVRSRAADVAARLPDPVTLLCASGPRSEEAARLLAEQGCMDIEILQGGLQAWRAADGDVVAGKGTWAMERQVRLAAGSFVVAGVLGSVITPKLKWLSAAIGGGLIFSALSNTCGMARVLSLLPYNRRGAGVAADQVLNDLETSRG